MFTAVLLIMAKIRNTSANKYLTFDKQLNCGMSTQWMIHQQ